mgnify:CR=1 FL=1
MFGDSFTNPLETIWYASFDETRSLDLRYVRAGYTLTGYYDATPERGGQLRIIVAIPKS